MTFKSSGGSEEVEISGQKCNFSKWTLSDTNDFDAPGFAEAFRIASEAMDGFAKEMSVTMRGVFTNNRVFFRLVSKAIREERVRRRCWWHCKKCERRKNGRRPIVKTSVEFIDAHFAMWYDQEYKPSIMVVFKEE